MRNVPENGGKKMVRESKYVYIYRFFYLKSKVSLLSSPWVVRRAVHRVVQEVGVNFPAIPTVEQK